MRQINYRQSHGNAQTKLSTSAQNKKAIFTFQHNAVQHNHASRAKSRLKESHVVSVMLLGSDTTEGHTETVEKSIPKQKKPKTADWHWQLGHCAHTLSCR